MSTNTNLFELLLNDIKNIVFRYIHFDKYNQCMRQYQSVYQSNWDEQLNCFYNLETRLEAMWRDLTRGNNNKVYEIIYPIIDCNSRHRRYASLPDNY